MTRQKTNTPDVASELVISAPEGADPSPADQGGQKRYLFRSVSPRIVVAFSVVAAGFVYLLVDNVRERLRVADLLHSDSLRTEAWVRAAAGFVLVVLLLVVWGAVAPRHVVHSLDALKTLAHYVRVHLLPEVARRLANGEPVDVDQTMAGVRTKHTFGPDQFGDVGREFLAVTGTALEENVTAARQERGIEVITSLTRRNQRVIALQLRAIDQAERQDPNPKQMETLFTIDRNTMELRRNTHYSLILAGQKVGPRRRDPALLIDVLRAAWQAAGNMEDLKRIATVNYRICPEVWFPARVVDDVVHALSALIDNALKFSPPGTQVVIRAGFRSSDGCVIEIEDRGKGLTDDEFKKYNARLTGPTVTILSADITQLGLYAVNRLVQPYGIKVSLHTSAYLGVTATVVIPCGLLMTVAPTDPTSPETASPETASPGAANSKDRPAGQQGHPSPRLVVLPPGYMPSAKALAPVSQAAIGAAAETRHEANHEADRPDHKPHPASARPRPSPRRPPVPDDIPVTRAAEYRRQFVSAPDNEVPDPPEPRTPTESRR